MLDLTDKYRVHPEPRISANQLAEYSLASPSRRQAILRNAKFAPTFLVIRYTDARASVCDFLRDPTRPVAMLHKSEAELRAKADAETSGFKANDALLSAEAVASFAHAASSKQLPVSFTKLFFEPVTGNWPKLMMEGVQVSTQVDLISKNTSKGKCGGVMLQTSKAIAAKSWREEHSLYVTSLIWMSCSQSLTGHGDVDRGLCFAVDLFAQKAIKAPTSYKRRVKDLQASCQEIAALWGNVQPPADL